MSVRRAYVCIDSKTKAVTCRRFLMPGEPEPPKCERHGRMTRQGNHPYNRKSSK